ncbi:MULTISPECIES: TonB-dependent siderophore receptor [Pseudomonas]|uniref:TonB-dependent siderophore receptor n=1 Tax=Pseudomonadaceae TaxID=135621 RepID=UPI000561E2F6
MRSSSSFSPSANTLKPLARLVRATAFGLALGASAPLLAEPVRIDLPAQPLASALTSLGEQTELQILFNPAQLSRLRSNAVTGEMEALQALDALLEGTGVRYQLDGNRVSLFTSAGDNALALPEQVIEGRSEGQSSFVPKTSNSASKTNTSILEIPQSVSVITRAQLEAQGAQSVTEALRYVPGVKVETYGLDPKGYDWLFIRGFNGQSTSDYLNGLRQQNNDYALFRSEPYALERVDVVRGPASTLFGQGDAGGVINRVSKKPTANQTNEIQLTAGSHDRRQGQFDVGGALDEQSQFLYRVVGLYREANTQVEYDDGHELEDDRQYIAPSFTWAPNEDTSLTLLTDFLRDRNGGSLFVYTKPNGHTTDTLLGDHSFNRFDQDQYNLGYEFRHRFNDTLEFRQNLRYGQVDLTFNNLLPFSINQTTGNVVRIADRRNQHMDTFAVDNQLQADFTTGSIRHTLLSGVDYSWQDADVTFYRNFGPTLNVFNPVYGQPVTTPGPTNGLTQADYNQTIEQLGAYVQDQIHFDDHWLLTLGGRHDRVRNDFDNNIPNSQSTNQKDDAFTGRVGLTYVTDFGLAPYISYAESFAPNSGVSSQGSTFDPSEAEQWEVGVKYQPHDDLLLTLAAYDLTKTNILTAERNSSGATTGFNVAEGEQRSRGIEAEARLKLGEHWDILGSYTYTKAQITRSNDGNQGNRPANVPEHMASAWVNYNFSDGSLRGLTLGAGARYVGSMYGNNANTFGADSYTLFDASASYKLTPQVTLAVYAQNLLNEDYTATCDAATSCYPGLERNLMTSVKYSW